MRFVDTRGVIQRVPINQARAAKVPLAERHALVLHDKRFVAVERLPVGARAVCGVNRLVRPSGSVVSNVLAAIERNHRIPVGERVFHLFVRLEVVAVRTKPALKILPKHRKRRAVQHVRKRALRQVQLANGLLREHGQRVVCFKHAQVSGRRNAETVANAKRAPLAQYRLWRGKRKNRAEHLGVFVCQRREKRPVRDFAGKAGVRAGHA